MYIAGEEKETKSSANAVSIAEIDNRILEIASWQLIAQIITTLPRMQIICFSKLVCKCS